MHDLVRAVPTPAELALFLYLLPHFSMSTKVDYSRVATECNNRIIQAFVAGKLLDAYPDNARELGKFGGSYVSKVRERDSLMLCFLQALTPPPTSFCLLSLHPTPDDPRAFKNQHPCSITMANQCHSAYYSSNTDLYCASALSFCASACGSCPWRYTDCFCCFSATACTHASASCCSCRRCC